MKNIFCLLFCCLFVQSVFAQKKEDVPIIAKVVQKPKLIMIGRLYADSVVLRWSPNMPAYWLSGNKRGYILERTEYAKDQTKEIKQLMTASPIKPWPFEEMKRRLPEDEKGIGVVGEMIYGYPSDQKFKADFFSIKQITSEQATRFATTLTIAEFDPKAADAAGLRFVDKNIKKKDAIYEYRLWMGPSEFKNSFQLDTATVTIVAGQDYLTFAPFVQSPEIGDHKTTLIWDRVGPTGNFSAFYIEKSEDGKNFTRVNETPYMMGKPDDGLLKNDSLKAAQLAKWQDHVFYIDSLQQNYKNYYYQIKGIDSFGEISAASPMITVQGRDLTAPLPANDFKAKNIDNKKIQLSWKKPRKETDFKGFVVGRGATVNGPFLPLTKTILPIETTTFTDEDPQAYIGDYYIIAAVDTSGNLGYTLPIAGGYEDHIAPNPATDLVARTDSSGHVSINWKAPDNLDLTGFKVYRSYTSANEYYNQITPSKITEDRYVDTLATKMLNEYVYYKIVSIDISNNHSNFSKVLEVKLPDRNPPTTPLIKEIVLNEEGAAISIIGSRSDDVVTHELYRKENNGNWKLLQSFPIDKNTKDFDFVDKTVQHDIKYEYAIEAIDDDKLRSPKSFPIPIHYLNLNNHPSAKGLTAKINAQNKTIELTWQATQNPTLSHYIIYRNTNDGGLEMINSSKTATFIDKSTKEGERYTYAIRVVYAEGKMSKISERVAP